MPSFAGIDHLAITVSDLAVSVPFYERVWGMAATGELEGEGLRRTVFALPSGTTVGLTQHEDPEGGGFSPFTPGLDHVGFGVADRDELQAWADHLDAEAIDNDGLVEADYGIALSFKDPDGTALEFFVRK